MLKVNICLTDLLNCANIFTLLSSLVKVLQRDYTDLNKTHLQQCLRVKNMESNIKKQEKLLTSKDEENAALEKVLREQQVIIKLALKRIFPTVETLKLCPVRS